MSHASRFKSLGQPYTGSVFDEADSLDLGRMLHSVYSYKWSILGLALAIALAAAFMVFSMEPVYRASASIVLESQQANVVNVEEVYTLDAYDYNYQQTQFEILKSRNLAERVVRRLNLYKDAVSASSQAAEPRPWYRFDLGELFSTPGPEPLRELSAAEQEEQLIEALSAGLAGGLEVVPVEYSYMVYLQYESTDREQAARIVNTFAEEFISGNLENRLSGTLDATNWLSERLEDLKENLRQSERALQDFRDREGLVDIEGVTGLGGNELKTLSQRLQEATKSRIEAENIMKDVQGMAGATTDELMTLPAVLRHELVRDLKRDYSVAERKVSELAKRYGPKHPKMIAAQSDLSAANNDLAREVRKVVSGISHEYGLARRNEQQLQTSWESRKSEMQDFNRVEFQLQELQRDVETNRQLYDIFLTRIKSVSESGGLEKPHARIVDRATVPRSPIKPNKRMSISLAFMLGIMLGCVVAILLDILDNTVKNPDDVTEKLHAPLLGIVPKQTLDKSGRFLQFWQDPRSQFAESVRTLRTGVVLSGLDNPAKVIVVTSTVPGEGKSTIALNLGSALGQMEKTLLIGADLRRPILAQQCDLAPNHMGLSHLVSGAAPLDDCIEYLPELRLHVMPAGVIPANPLELISSRKFVEMLEQLRGKFERIVIDSAPLQAVSDALMLASYADSIVYVVRADSTPATQVRKGLASIVGSNEPLAGVVLNQFDTQRADNRYGGGYYQYDSYSPREEPKV